MQSPLAAIDAELESLGEAPKNALNLARRFAPAIDATQSFVEIDAALSELAEGVDTSAAQAAAGALGALATHVGSNAPASPKAPSSEAPSAQPRDRSSRTGDSTPAPRASSAPPRKTRTTSPPVEAPPKAREPGLTESQEIVLPDPIAREELSTESGELSLDADEPGSGSFELPDDPTQPRAMLHDSATHGLQDSALLASFDDVQDALEGSEPVTFTSPRSSSSPFALGDRDPDAEFDALLSEATDAHGIPVRASGEVDTDELLRGLEGDDLTEVTPDTLSPAGIAGAREADLLTQSLLDDEEGEHTDVIDRDALEALEAASVQDDELVMADELDSGELEIVLEGDDQEDGADTIAPPLAQTGKAPPPPPHPDDKRPHNLLGRLFGKRDES